MVLDDIHLADAGTHTSTLTVITNCTYNGQFYPSRHCAAVVNIYNWPFEGLIALKHVTSISQGYGSASK